MNEDLDTLIKNFERLLAPESFLASCHKRLYLSLECLNGLFYTLLNSNYVPKNERILLASIIKYQKPEEVALVEILNKPIPELRYINKKTRLLIFPILQSFLAVVSTLNENHKGKCFELDGTLTPDFIRLLQKNVSKIEAIQAVAYDPTTQIGTVAVYTKTQLEPERQTELKRIIDEHGSGSGETISIVWGQGERVDDQFKVGDTFSSQLCVLQI